MEYFSESTLEDVYRYRAEDLSWPEIGRKLDVHPERIRSAFRRWKRTNRLTMWDGVLGPIRPVKVKFDKKAASRDLTKISSGVVTQVIFGDVHVPYHDRRVWRLLIEVIEMSKPDSIVHVGDHLDAYMLSDFMKDPNRKETLQDEINIAKGLLAEVRMAAPKARIDLLEGNHEERLRRALWRAPTTQAVLLALTDVQRILTWPKLLSLDDMGIFWHPNDTVVKIAPRFYAHHGNTKGDPFHRFGVSGVSGHSHTMKLQSRRTLPENLEWFTVGTLGTLDPEYDIKPSWQHGFWVITHRVQEDGTVTRASEQVNITYNERNDNYEAVFRGRLLIS